MYRNRTTIEFANFSDIIEIGNLSREYIERDLGWKYTPKKLKNLLKSDIKNVVVVRNDKELIGFGIMTYKEEHANLDLLAVKGNYHRKGIGTQIVKWLEDVALTAGIFNIFVQVRKINIGAIKFYKKLGFIIIDEIKGYYRGQETAVIMSKNIREMIVLHNTALKGDAQKSRAPELGR